MPEDTVADARRGFGRIVGIGLAAGVVAAIAGNQAWVAVADQAGGQDERVVGGVGVQLDVLADASAPPVTALALVLLATWGVVLVTRGTFRRAITALGLLAALGTFGFAVLVWSVAPDSVRTSLDAPDLDLHHTFWSYVGVLAGVVAVGASARAIGSVRHWPEMGRKYDAPVVAEGEPAATPAEAPGDDATNLDLWKWIDQGHDPTDGPERPGSADDH